MTEKERKIATRAIISLASFAAIIGGIYLLGGPGCSLVAAGILGILLTL